MSIKTVKIVVEDHPNGYVIINECDLKESDKIYSESKNSAQESKIYSQRKKRK